MTGLHSGHSPIRANREIGAEGQMPLPSGTFTVAQLLKSAGYTTACIGKWGMGMFDTTGSPLKLGFDHFFGYNCQRHEHSYFPKFLYNDDRRFDLPGNDGSEEIEGKGAIYSQDLIADETLKFVKANRDRPFFLYYSVTLPHARVSDQRPGHLQGQAVDRGAEELRRDGYTPRQRRGTTAHVAEGTESRRQNARAVLAATTARRSRRLAARETFRAGRQRTARLQTRL